VRKQVGSTTILFIYDESGHLLGEYDASGALIQETIWFGDAPAIVLKPNAGSPSIYYVHADHLSTPREVSDGSSTTVWVWDTQTFGSNEPNQDPGDGSIFTFNLRFPGQYFDAEIDISYNYLRDGYEAGIGRFTQPDPIGLKGGSNIYAYAEGNPLLHVDRLGLQAASSVIDIPYPGVGAGAGAGTGAGAGAILGRCLGIGIGLLTYATETSACDTVEKPPECQGSCPPCKTVSGKTIPIGTIAYRPLDTPSKPEHGIVGPHYNIYKAN
jgi:RHS repeat-associated protein